MGEGRVSFLAVFDGHGGVNIAASASEELHNRVLAAGLVSRKLGSTWCCLPCPLTVHHEDVMKELRGALTAGDEQHREKQETGCYRGIPKH